MSNDLHVFTVTPSVKYWPATLAAAGMIVLTGLIMLALQMLGAVPAIVVMCVGLVMTVHPALKAGNTEYIVMSDRIIARAGLVRKTEQEILLADVQSIRIDYGQFGESLDVALVEVIGARGSLLMEGVESPERVRERILQLK